jgi:hypothetical protein
VITPVAEHLRTAEQARTLLDGLLRHWERYAVVAQTVDVNRASRAVMELAVTAG